MRLRRPLSVLAAITLTAGALAAGAPASAAPAGEPAPVAGPDGYTPPAIDWKDCSDDYAASKLPFECGRVVVPIDWSNPSGETASLAVTRVKHTTEPYQGVMLVNPGGPGGSGTGLASLKTAIPDGGGDGYDWIGFDPRGVGESTPSLHCIDDYTNGVRPPYEPTTKRIERAWLKLSKSYAAACRQRNGAILDHMTTVDAVKDMDAIRAALGKARLNFYGFSYGTYLGQVYSTLFPSHVRRMVFDGTVDPRGVWYRANLQQDVAFERTIDIWFGWVAKYDRAYHLGTTRAAVSARYSRVKAQLTKHPVGDVGGSEWNDMLLQAGYYQTTWTDLAQVFSDWAVKHDRAALKTGYEDYVEAEDDNGFAVYSAVQCTDASWPSSYAAYERDNRRVAKKAPFETWGNAWFNAPCLFWKVPSTTPVHIDGSGVKSVLMINETLDAATPYPGSIEVRKRFPGARLIAEPGGTTHAGSLYGNACVDDRIAAYLAHGTLPKRKAGSVADVTCKPLPRPVPKGAASSKGGSAKGSGAQERLSALRGALAG